MMTLEQPRIDAPEQAPDVSLDELERRAVDNAMNAFAVARQARDLFGERAADGEDIGQWRALRAELATVLAALRADRPRQIAAREEALASGGRTPLSVDDAFRLFELRIERVVILTRRIDAKLWRAT
jgi:hypothetical protein